MAATAVIFDLDGTIWDSRPYYAAALAADGPDGPEAALMTLETTPAATALRRAGFTPARYRSHCQIARVEVYPQGLDALRQLDDQGIPLGAVTNLPSWMADPMLACHGLDELFGSIVTAGRAKPGKPHPAPLLLCCQELDVHADQRCWYVGDSPNDCSAALAAGLSFAWVTWGYGSTAPTGAHRSLSSFADVASL